MEYRNTTVLYQQPVPTSAHLCPIKSKLSSFATTDRSKVCDWSLRSLQQQRPVQEPSTRLLGAIEGVLSS